MQQRLGGRVVSPLCTVEAQNAARMFRPHVVGAEPERTVGGLDDTVVIDAATQPGVELQRPGWIFSGGEPGHRGLLAMPAHRPQHPFPRGHESLGLLHQPILFAEARPPLAVETDRAAVPAHEPETAIRRLTRETQPLIGHPARRAIVQTHGFPSQRRDPERAVGGFQQIDDPHLRNQAGRQVTRPRRVPESVQFASVFADPERSVRCFEERSVVVSPILFRQTEMSPDPAVEPIDRPVAAVGNRPDGVVPGLDDPRTGTDVQSILLGVEPPVIGKPGTEDLPPHDMPHQILPSLSS